ncbi:hypothetical protein NUM3379_36580 [Kineococcus sp. NUM-3379]
MPGTTPPGQPPGRTGTEPRTARSPLQLRLVLAVFGVLFCGAFAVVALTSADRPGWLTALGVVTALLAVAGVVDAVVVTGRIRRSHAGRL